MARRRCGNQAIDTPLILPPPGMTDPEAGMIAAERGYGI